MTSRKRKPEDRVGHVMRRSRCLINMPRFVPPNGKVSDGSQPPLTLDLSLSESAGSRSLDRLVRLCVFEQSSRAGPLVPRQGAPGVKSILVPSGSSGCECGTAGWTTGNGPRLRRVLIMKTECAVTQAQDDLLGHESGRPDLIPFEGDQQDRTLDYLDGNRRLLYAPGVPECFLEHPRPLAGDQASQRRPGIRHRHETQLLAVEAPCRVLGRQGIQSARRRSGEDD